MVTLAAAVRVVIALTSLLALRLVAHQTALAVAGLLSLLLPQLLEPLIQSPWVVVVVLHRLFLATGQMGLAVFFLLLQRLAGAGAVVVLLIQEVVAVALRHRGQIAVLVGLERLTKVLLAV